MIQTLWKDYPKEVIAVGVIVAIKLLVLILLPVTGDEAYFLRWAAYPAAGYYDHPPMIGWLAYVMGFINQNIMFYRLFSVFTVFVLAYVIYLLANTHVSKQKSSYVALLFLVSPIDLLILLFTNDIVLVLFGTLGTYFFFTALEQHNFKRALLAGLLFGLAFLSKYFIVILLFPLLVYAVLVYKKRAIAVVAIAVLTFLPFVAQNLYFNYNSCWNNIMFNFLIRPQADYDVKFVLSYVTLTIYLFSPWGLWMLLQSNMVSSSLRSLLFSVLGFALFVFLVVSLKNPVGLHWFLLFVPYIYLLFIYLDEKKLIKLFRFNYIFALVHGALLLGIVLAPISMFKSHGQYSSLVYITKPAQICQTLEPYADESLFTLGYTPASTLSYACNRDLHMLFNTSKFGRMDDKIVDVRKLDGQNIMVFDSRPIEQSNFSGVCGSITVKQFVVEGADFYLATCHQFSYAKYKEAYLDVIKQKIYDIPSWLPQGQCYFEDMYYQ